MKRWWKAGPLLVTMLLFFWRPVPAGAVDLPAEKAFILTDSAGAGVIEESPAEPAFWEYPTVPAGQTKLTQGTLTIRNDTAQNAAVQLKEVELPDDSPEAMAYLAALTITIRDGDTVLYDGPYSAINNGEFRLNTEVAPGESKSYTISLRCAFAYEGDAATAARQLFWAFSATSVVEENPGGTLPPISPVALTLFCVAGGLVILCTVMGLYTAIRKVKR